MFDDGSEWSESDISYWARAGSAFFAGGSGADTILGSFLDQRLSGGSGADFIDGRGGSDLIFGDAGDDVSAVSQIAVGEQDALNGGDGNDTVTFAELGNSVWVDLVGNGGEARSSHMANPTAAADRLIATLIGIENIGRSTGKLGATELRRIVADAGSLRGWHIPGSGPRSS